MEENANIQFMPPKYYLEQFFDARKENPDVKLEIVSVFDNTHFPSEDGSYNSKGWYTVLGNKIGAWEKNFRNNAVIVDDIPWPFRVDWNNKAKKLIETLVDKRAIWK